MKIRIWRYKRERRGPHSSFVSFSLSIFELCNLNVLRVLSKQILETNKEVKDSSVPGPSLAKVVKDSTLTILLSFIFISKGIVKTGRRFGGFSTDWPHCWRREGSICLGGGRFEAKPFPEAFAITIAPYLFSLSGVFSPYLLLLHLGEFFEGGCTLTCGSSELEG